ncbi:MAG: hypothetical protein E7436_00425 [Ruminococcaceae bacterium]|nr:hypothetical protein [Oscillospiraceae bacterium]
MDHYITEFNLQRSRAQVRDYAVFMEKKGLGALNPFGMSRQLVVYITDRGCYALFVRGMGEFTEARKLCDGDLTFSADGRLAACSQTGRRFKFIRKYNSGPAADAGDFVRLLQSSI